MHTSRQQQNTFQQNLKLNIKSLGNFSGERKTCTSENSLQKLSKNPTNTMPYKLKTAQYQLASIYIKEQIEYIQNQIDKIRDSVEDRQSRIAWQTITKWAEERTQPKQNWKQETNKKG